MGTRQGEDGYLLTPIACQQLANHFHYYFHHINTSQVISLTHEQSLSRRTKKQVARQTGAEIAYLRSQLNMHIHSICLFTILHLVNCGELIDRSRYYMIARVISYNITLLVLLDRTKYSGFLLTLTLLTIVHKSLFKFPDLIRKPRSDIFLAKLLNTEIDFRS